ncbi:MAG: VPLPA-CTERM sorting domain-containing protein [Candidatus Thiodiazotropha endolucinida]
MKKLFCTLALLAGIVSTSVFGGTVIDAGTFTDNGDAYNPSPYSGIFTDVIHFDIATSGLSLIFSGSHTGMAADDMLLTNTNDGAAFHLGPVFSESLSLAQGSYVFTLSGFALNALDSKIYSDYDLTISAVPLPAAAWLFGSALLGFIAFSARRKI